MPHKAARGVVRAGVHRTDPVDVMIIMMDFMLHHSLHPACERQ
jgi:hypothetical protein